MGIIISSMHYAIYHSQYLTHFKGAHADGTPWSFVVNLNNPQKDFTGGGRVLFCLQYCSVVVCKITVFNILSITALVIFLLYYCLQ